MRKPDAPAMVFTSQMSPWQAIVELKLYHSVFEPVTVILPNIVLLWVMEIVDEVWVILRPVVVPASKNGPRMLTKELIVDITTPVPVTAVHMRESP